MKNPGYVREEAKKSQQVYIEAACLNKKAQMDGTGIHYVVCRQSGPKREMICCPSDQVPEIPQNKEIIARIERQEWPVYFETIQEKIEYQNKMKQDKKNQKSNA